MTKHLIVTNSSSIAPCQVLAERITPLAEHDQTGSYEVYVHDAKEGAGPPPHSHPWDEAFYVVEGVVEFECAGTRRSLAAGGFVHVPAGMVHSFRYASPTARILGVTSGAGACAMFADVDRECGEAPDMQRIAAVLGRHHVDLAVQPS
jgi:quercetin dioxygenase-like cupin family protein